MKLNIDGENYYVDCQIKETKSGTYELEGIQLPIDAFPAEAYVRNADHEIREILKAVLYKTFPADLKVVILVLPFTLDQSRELVCFENVIVSLRENNKKNAELLNRYLRYNCITEIEKQLHLKNHAAVIGKYRILRDEYKNDSGNYKLNPTQALLRIKNASYRVLENYVAAHLEELREYKLLRRIIKVYNNIQTKKANAADLQAAIKKYKDFCEQANMLSNERVFVLMRAGVPSTFANMVLGFGLSCLGFSFAAKGVFILLATAGLSVAPFMSVLFVVGMLFILSGTLLAGFISYAYRVRQANIALEKRNQFISELERMSAKITEKQSAELEAAVEEEKEKEKEDDLVAAEIAKDKPENKKQEDDSLKHKAISAQYAIKYGQFSRTEKIAYQPGEKPRSWSPTLTSFKF
jgi:hypothetical protein